MKSIRSFIFFAAILVVFLILVLNKQAISSYLIKSTSHQEIEQLRMENLSLKSEIESLKSSVDIKRGEHSVARVYSRYPFDGNENLIINLGEKDGITEGMPVITEENILVGKVLKVNNFLSEVETIFNLDWKESVVIESSESRALFTGGDYPMVDLIPKETFIQKGDMVLNISPGLPLNTLIGTIDEIEEDPNEPWKRAKVDIPYSLSDLSKVLVLTQFP